MARRHRYFAIIGSMRTGSNLLQQSLDRYPDLVCHGELFNPQFIDKPGMKEFQGVTLERRDRDPLGFIEHIIEDASPGLAGFRIFDRHDQRVLEHVANDPDCACILLTRPPLDSFVSLLIAQATDQWMLRDPVKRRLARVHLDPAAFARYRQDLLAFWSDVNERLQKAGRAGFPIAFEQLGKRDILNGLATFIGSEHRLERIATDMVRQNPGPIEQKLENPEALAEIAARSDTGTERPIGKLAVRTFAIAPARGLMFAPLPGGPDRRVKDWMTRLPGEPPQTGMTRRGIDSAYRAGQIRTLFTVTRHPFLRAHDVFMRKLMAPGQDGFMQIRKWLGEQHGLDFPEAETATDRASLERAGFGLDRQRDLLARFLRFLRDNLAGGTLIRVDGLWASQCQHIAALTGEYPPGLILREPDLPGWAEALSPGVLPDPPEEDAGPWAAGELWTEQLGDLCQKAYPLDHLRLGYRADAPPE